jgi:hypothetical protein
MLARLHIDVKCARLACRRRARLAAARRPYTIAIGRRQFKRTSPLGSARGFAGGALDDLGAQIS